MIVIVDYGMGNLGSIANMLKQVGAPAIISADPQVITGAERLILAGVGAFDAGMERLHNLGLIPTLERMVLEQEIPFLGICLGMQLLGRRSEEGQRPGLGWLEADTVRFDFGANPARLRIPHMGWNELQPRTSHPLLQDLGEEPRFYFVHSFYVRCDRREDVLAQTEYGLWFDAVVGRGNLLGTQFHPEKSHRYGKKVLQNFVEWRP
jgi:glutamine amidotransferase